MSSTPSHPYACSLSAAHSPRRMAISRFSFSGFAMRTNNKTPLGRRSGVRGSTEPMLYCLPRRMSSLCAKTQRLPTGVARRLDVGKPSIWTPGKSPANVRSWPRLCKNAIAIRFREYQNPSRPQINRIQRVLRSPLRTPRFARCFYTASADVGR
jgi:hypothetical protein